MRLAILALFFSSAAAPLAAQDLPGRVDRLEQEMHAVQRKVFPGGNPDYFQPQIQAAPAAPDTTGTPATSALSDLTTRVNALEAQVRQLTDQTEVNNHRLDQLEQSVAKMKADAQAAPPPVPAAGADTGATAASGTPTPFGPSGRKPLPAGVKPAPPADAGDTMGDQAAGAGIAAVAGGAAPAPAKTGDPAEDLYMAGYTAWSQKDYAGAEDKLKQVVAKYPDSKRASYAQNLLGRSYMDDGQLSTAADAFLTSYKKFPRGDRAPDSLYYLGQTLTKLKKASQACQVYDELRDVYGATINPTLKARVAQGRTDAKCGA